MNKSAVKVICSECGHGHYVADKATRILACSTCGHEVQRRDIEPNLTEGETLMLTKVNRVLIIVSDES